MKKMIQTPAESRRRVRPLSVWCLATGMAVALLCGSCTERRTASAPVPDGDTIEVVIDTRARDRASDARRVIVVGPEATPTDSIEIPE